jgi:hypothetical protein
MPIVGRITLDGIPIGVIRVNLTAGDMATYPPGLDFGPREEPEGAPFGPGSPRGPGAHTGLPAEHGPTFRRGLHPRGKAPPAHPEHYTTKDIHKALEGTKPEHFTTADVQTAVRGEHLTGSAYLAQERARMAHEVNSDPHLAAELRGLAVAEDARDPAGVVESLANRAAFTGRSIRELMHSGFYGPMKHGRVRPNDNPRVQAAIESVWAGSNRLRGATDQGMAGDPNAAWQGGRIHPPGGTPGAIYNDWGGGVGGHEGARRFREEQQRRVEQGGSSAPVGTTRLGPEPTVHPEGAADKKSKGTPPQQALSIARKIAVEQGFDPNKVILGENPYKFKIGKEPADEDIAASAIYTPSKDVISIFPENLGVEEEPGIISHELFHAKVNDYMKKHAWPSTSEALDIMGGPKGPVFRGRGIGIDGEARKRSIGPGAGRDSTKNVVSGYGQDYIKAIPQGPVFRGGSAAHPATTGPGAGKSEMAYEALNENLAEMARIKYEQKDQPSKTQFYPQLEDIYGKIENAWKSKK